MLLPRCGVVGLLAPIHSTWSSQIFENVCPTERYNNNRIGLHNPLLDPNDPNGPMQIQQGGGLSNPYPLAAPAGRQAGDNELDPRLDLAGIRMQAVWAEEEDFPNQLSGF